MNILIFPFGSAGDVFPLIGLAQALQARGHRATIAIHGHFREAVLNAGIEYVESGTEEEFLEQTRNPHLWKPTRGFGIIVKRGIARAMRPQYELIEERLADRPVVIANAFGFGPRLAQEKLGVPLITVHLQPACFWSEYESPQFPYLLTGPSVPRWLKRLQFGLGNRLFFDPVALPTLNAFRRELGLPKQRHVTRWWHSSECVLGLFPEWFAPPQPDWPEHVHLADFPLWDPQSPAPFSDELREFLDGGDPPMVITPGSAHQHASRFFAEAVHACRQLGRRTLLMTRFPQQLPRPLPPGSMACPFAPFSVLLPRAAAIIHDGGIGTTSQAMKAGLPQFIMPMSFDQPDNAARLKRLGIGDALPPTRFTAGRIAPRLRRLLESAEVQDTCRAVAGRFDGVDPFARACRVVESFAGSIG